MTKEEIWEKLATEVKLRGFSSQSASSITDSSCFLVTPAGGNIVLMGKQKHFAAAQGFRVLANNIKLEGY